jgi:glutathione S-transferase
MSARSFRALWALEELRVPYDLVVMPFPPRVHSAAYLEVNPLGTVPLLLDGDTRMTESAAICEYLAARYGRGSLGVTPEETGYGDYLNFLHFGEATLTFPQTLILRYGRFETPDRRSPQVVEDYTRWFFARLKSLEGLLAGRPYVCAERFTAADISVGYALMLADYLGFSSSFRPHTKTYWDRLKARDAFTRAVDVQEKAALSQGIATTPAPLA